MKWLGVVGGLVAAQFAIAGAAFVDIPNGLAFPQDLNGLQFKYVHQYDEPGLGYSLRYMGDATHKIDIYIYNLDMDVPDGITNEPVKKESRSVSRIVSIMEERGEYDDVRSLTKTSTPLSGKIRFIKESYQYTEKGQEKLSESYITGHKGNFYKIRFTYLAKDRAKAKQYAKAMVTGLIGVMEREPKEARLALESARLFQSNPASSAGKFAGAQIMTYVFETEGFTVQIPVEVFPWLQEEDSPRSSHLLIQAYLAGALEYLLENKLSKGGSEEGFSAMLDAYILLQKSDNVDKIGELEDWKTSNDRKALFNSIMSAEPKEEE